MFSTILKLRKLSTAIAAKKSFSTNIDNFLNGNTAAYVEQLFNQWKTDRKSVHASWDIYFSNIENGLDFNSAFQSNPEISGNFAGQKKIQVSQNVNNTVINNEFDKLRKVLLLINSYQRNGFINADIDPLKLGDSLEHEMKKKFIQNQKSLDYKNYGFTENDLNLEFNIFDETKQGIQQKKEKLTLKQIIDHLNKSYCSSIGIEYMFITSREERNFLSEKLEVKWPSHKLKNEEKIKLFNRLSWAVLFEEFLQKKFTTHKRFGLEGLESLIIGLKSFVDYSVNLGVKDVTLGMAHRGRLNVLANVFKKPLSKIFAEFQGKWEEHDTSEFDFQGDVKYHLGTSLTRTYKNGKQISLDIPPNPSHLEAVNPVVQGQTRAKQHFNDDKERDQYISILIHGDAAFSGQGVIYETAQMQFLNNYEVGGILHVIANNQIGFTTSIKEGRSTPYCTDIAKAYEVPIIHVNAEDPEAVAFAFEVAAEYRNKFNKDVILDVIGYRKHGHNEIDQPFFTNPLMYNVISKKKSVLESYEKKLIQEGLNQKELENIKKSVLDFMERSFTDASNNKFDIKDWVPKQWQNFANISHKFSPPVPTGIKLDRILEMNEKINILPQDFTFHPQIKKIFEARYNSIKTGKGIDWATAEALSWGSLLQEDHLVRISGQDVERGTFSHRHAVLHDQKENKKWVPLYSVSKNSKNFQACNSHLSEFAVLGFEYGFAIADPNSLILWEAQFGDFSNGAQIIIDQFLASGESKWNLPNGLVMLLPHGMDGQGAEHSNCHIERYLQLVDDDPTDKPDFSEVNYDIEKTNIQVCNPTFSANYFHVLRRQLKREFRKPLIIPSPKRLLRYPQAGSNIEDFLEGKSFVKVRGDELATKNPEKIKKVLICSGQVYYDLINERSKIKNDETAIFTLEQVAPFPYKQLRDQIQKFTNAKFYYVQEEHMNSGPWFYVKDRINNLLSTLKFKNDRVEYIGRYPSSTTATGHTHTHEIELRKLLNDSFIKV